MLPTTCHLNDRNSKKALDWRRDVSVLVVHSLTLCWVSKLSLSLVLDSVVHLHAGFSPLH